jgi:hypothetical protein
VQANEIESGYYSWSSIILAPGIFVLGKSYDTYRVAVNQAYLLWLSDHKFDHELDLEPTRLVDAEVDLHGEWKAKNNTYARFVEDGMMAIKCDNLTLDDCFRINARGTHLLPIRLRRIALTIARNLILRSVPDSLSSYGTYWARASAAYPLSNKMKMNCSKVFGIFVSRELLKIIMLEFTEFRFFDHYSKMQGREFRHEFDLQSSVISNVNIVGSMVGTCYEVVSPV